MDDSGVAVDRSKEAIIKRFIRVGCKGELPFTINLNFASYLRLMTLDSVHAKQDDIFNCVAEVAFRLVLSFIVDSFKDHYEDRFIEKIDKGLHFLDSDWGEVRHILLTESF